MRLKSRREFNNVYHAGFKIVKSNLVVLYYPNDFGFNRLGVVVSSKVGKAIIRNRIKRVVREIFRLKRHMLNSACDIIIVARRIASEADYSALEKDLLEAFESINKASERQYNSG
jgi:ribonuclease P protein component